MAAALDREPAPLTVESKRALMRLAGGPCVVVARRRSGGREVQTSTANALIRRGLAYRDTDYLLHISTAGAREAGRAAFEGVRLDDSREIQ